MNKKWLFCFVALLCLTAVLMGCGCQKNEPDLLETTGQTEAPATATEPKNMIVGESDEEGISSEDIQPTEQPAEQETDPQEEKDPENTDSSKPASKPDKEKDEDKDDSKKPTEKPDEETKPEEGGNEETTEPSAPADEPEPEPKPSVCCEYQRYMNMSGAKQEAYMESFDSVMDFISWLKNAEAEHESHVSDKVIEGGNIDIGDYMG